jgi:hypothetical protein
MLSGQLKRLRRSSFLELINAAAHPMPSMRIATFMQPSNEIIRPLFGLHIDPSYVFAEKADAD